jgi:regulator of sigma E protease
MISTIFLVFFSLVGLIILHELGHFLVAKKFGVKVEEFGLFLPPRIWGKKIGETLYSINIIPAGAFVKLFGEDGAGTGDSRSFVSKPIWQRALIIAAGVISFWIVSVIIMSYVFMTSVVEQVTDDDNVSNARVMVLDIAPDSPAQTAGLRSQDFVESLSFKGAAEPTVKIEKVSQIQDFAKANEGKELSVSVKRGSENLELTVTPRVNPPDGQGAIGVSLVRTASKNYTWWQAIGNGFYATWSMTVGVFTGWGEIIGRLVNHQGLPAGAQLVGPIGIGKMMVQASQVGISFYLQFVAMISVYLAVFNALPIPALDGGRLFFLLLEGIRRKPVSEKWEQGLTTFFFIALMIFALVVTVQDVRRLL